MSNARTRGSRLAAALALAAFAPSALASAGRVANTSAGAVAAKATRKTPALPNPPDAHPHMGGPAHTPSPETPSRGELITAFRRVAPSVWDCAREHAGVVVARVTFGPTGVVSAVEFPRPDRTRRELVCMERAIREARVSPFGSASFTVNYPFNVGATRPEPPPPAAPPRYTPSPARAACANRCRGNIDCLLRCTMGP